MSKNSIYSFLYLLSFIMLSIYPVSSQQSPIVLSAGVEGCLINELAFSPDSKILATGSNHLRLWDVMSGELLIEFPKTEGTCISSIAFSPDGKQIATGGSHVLIEIWDIPTQKKIQMLQQENPSDPLSIHEFPRDYQALAFVPGSHQVLAGDTFGRIILWDRLSETFKQIANTCPFDRFYWITSANKFLACDKAFSFPDGQIIYDFKYGYARLSADQKFIYYYGSDGNLSFCNVNDYSLYKTIHFEIDHDFNAKFSNSDTMAFLWNFKRNFYTQNKDAENTFVDPFNKEILRTIIPAGQEKNFIDTVEFSSDDTKIAMSYGGTVYLYDISDLAAGVKGAENLRP